MKFNTVLSVITSITGMSLLVAFASNYYSNHTEVINVPNYNNSFLQKTAYFVLLATNLVLLSSDKALNGALSTTGTWTEQQNRSLIAKLAQARNNTAYKSNKLTKDQEPRRWPDRREVLAQRDEQVRRVPPSFPSRSSRSRTPIPFLSRIPRPQSLKPMILRPIKGTQESVYPIYCFNGSTEVLLVQGVEQLTYEKRNIASTNEEQYRYFIELTRAIPFDCQKEKSGKAYVLGPRYLDDFRYLRKHMMQFPSQRQCFFQEFKDVIKSTFFTNGREMLLFYVDKAPSPNALYVCLVTEWIPEFPNEEPQRSAAKFWNKTEVWVLEDNVKKCYPAYFLTNIRDWARY